jgi:cation diffusion facilitator family transporter
VERDSHSGYRGNSEKETPYILTAAEKNIQIQRIVVVVAITLLIVKFAAYFLTHSVAILTDAMESIVNVVAGLLGLYSLIVSARPRDEDHPYGHGKVEFISSAVEGTLIVMAGFLILYESINALILPKELHQLDYGLLLIASTAIVNYLMGTWCVRVGRNHNSYALIASGKHLQTDTYSTLGIIAGLIAIWFFKISWLDSAVAIFFGVIILYNGYKIVRQSVAGIMDETDEELLTKMVMLLNENRRENWIDLHNVRIIKYGPVLHLDAHITIPWYLNVHEAHDEIDALALLVRKEFGESLELYVHSDGCLDFSCNVCQKQDCTVRKHPFQRKVEWTIQNISTNLKHNNKT